MVAAFFDGIKFLLVGRPFFSGLREKPAGMLCRGAPLSKKMLTFAKSCRCVMRARVYLFI